MPAPELVFIHGWGLDARFWDRLAGHLPQFSHTCIDLGFFEEGSAPIEIPQSASAILVGHSLGFTHGIAHHRGWKGWIAINGFPRFVASKTKPGCIPPAALREMRMRLQADTTQTLAGFHQMIGASPTNAAPNTIRLRDGLDELRDGDIGSILDAIDCPGLALAGRRDPLVPVELCEELGTLARRGGVMLHEEAGHLLPQTHSAWCARAIADFISVNFGGQT